MATTRRRHCSCWDYRTRDHTIGIEADKEYRDLKGKVEYYETVVDYLQEIVRSVSNRSFQIKNAIEWRKFEAGI